MRSKFFFPKTFWFFSLVFPSLIAVSNASCALLRSFLFRKKNIAVVKKTTMGETSMGTSFGNMFRVLQDTDTERGMSNSSPQEPSHQAGLRPGRSFATVAASPPVMLVPTLPPVLSRRPLAREETVSTHTMYWGLETFDPDNYVRRAASHSIFYGTCYTCLYPNHSQKFCPLRRCKCGRWGHTDQVCPGIK